MEDLFPNKAKLEALDRIDKRLEWRSKTPDLENPLIGEFIELLKEKLPDWIIETKEDSLVSTATSGRKITSKSKIKDLAKLCFEADKRMDLYGEDSLGFFIEMYAMDLVDENNTKL